MPAYPSYCSLHLLCLRIKPLSLTVGLGGPNRRYQPHEDDMRTANETDPPRMKALALAAVAATASWVLGVLIFEFIRRILEALTPGPPTFHSSSIAFLSVVLFCLTWLTVPILVAAAVARRVYRRLVLRGKRSLPGISSACR
jgi:uncharacterized membrane protein